MQGLQFRPSGVVLLYFEHRPGLCNAAVGQNNRSKFAYFNILFHLILRPEFSPCPPFSFFPPPVIYVPEGTATCGIAIYVLIKHFFVIFSRFEEKTIDIIRSVCYIK